MTHTSDEPKRNDEPTGAVVPLEPAPKRYTRHSCPHCSGRGRYHTLSINGQPGQWVQVDCAYCTPGQ